MDEATRVVIGRWMTKAEHDLVTARTMLVSDPRVTDVVCHHSQQCAEKALKAYLVFIDVHIEKTHYLRRLLELCARSDESFHQLDELATSLSDYFADRYPDNWREIPVAEAALAADDAGRILDFVQHRISRGDGK